MSKVSNIVYFVTAYLIYVKLSVVDRHSFGPKISKCRNESSASNTHFRMSCSEGLWLRGFIGTSWLLYLVVNVLECTYLLATKISTIIGYIIITATPISKVPCHHACRMGLKPLKTLKWEHGAMHIKSIPHQQLVVLLNCQHVIQDYPYNNTPPSNGTHYWLRLNFFLWTLYQGIARTQSPTTTNYAVEISTFEKFARVSNGRLCNGRASPRVNHLLDHGISPAR